MRMICKILVYFTGIVLRVIILYVECELYVSNEDNLEVPQHIVEMAEMADEIVIDPSMDAEEYVQQFSPEEPGPAYHHHDRHPCRCS